MSNTNFDDCFDADRRFPKFNRKNIDGASTSSSSLIDLNKAPTDSDTKEESQNPRCSKSMVNDHKCLYPNKSAEGSALMNDEDQRAKKGKSKIGYEEEDDKKENVEDSHRRRFPQQNHGASMCCSFLVDLNKIPTDYETEEESQNDLFRRRRNFENLNGASTSKSFLNHDCFEPSSSNPNYKSSPSSCLSKGGFKKANIASFPGRETPEWLVQVMRDMNGAKDLRLIFERSLSASDVNKGQSRLLIPFNMLLRNDFLTPEEALAVAKDEDNDEDDENIGVGSILVNQRSEKWGVRFKIWEMKKKNSGKGTLNYILNWGWNDVVKGNGLREGDDISLWSFRWRGVLCFALGTE